MSVHGYAQLGSTLSIRSVARLGAQMSVLDFASFGSSLSVRSLARFGASVSITSDKVYLGDSVILETNSDLQFDIGGSQKLKLSATESEFNGLWKSDGMITHSDRRLKGSVKPLLRGLGTKKADADSRASASWQLRELRPVSYRLREAPEAKAIGSERLGFVAQEVQKVMPSVVKGEGGETRGVMMEDLIAIFTATLQKQQARTEVLEAKVDALQKLVQNLLDRR